MEVYILDDFLRRIDVVDDFESLIWSERFRAYGDFELIMESNRDNRLRFAAGTKLSMSESKYVMTVKTQTDLLNNEGKKILKIQGPSLEKILEDRVAKKTMSDLSLEPTWDITGLPAVVARKIFHDICVLGTLDSHDVIPNVVEGASNGTIPEPSTSITVNLDPQSVYSAIKSICDTWDLGFRLRRLSDSTQLNFDIYTGSERTSSQVTFAPVIFAPELDNIQNISELTSIDGAKNVAYVFSPAGFKVVYPPSVDPTVAGFNRQVMFVKADDITFSSTSDVPAALTQRGIEELSKLKPILALDGEISQNSQYKYGVDYNLGDLVELRNTDSITNVMRVEEQIFVSDNEGKRSYPTLTINTFVNPGTWLSWKPNLHWGELTTEHWGEQ